MTNIGHISHVYDYILYKLLCGLPRNGLLVDMDFDLWLYIRCSSGSMNIQ